MRGALCGLVVCAIGGCTPSFSDETPIVTSARLLAVQALPAEAAPGATFKLTALYVGPDGPADPSSLDWATCLLRKPLGEPDPIAPSCFVASSPGLIPLGDGASASATMPQDACELFGPESPPPAPNQPSARPTDPDSTGGFYLPIRIRTGNSGWSATEERIACPPAGVLQSVFTAFTNGYRPNTNPTVAELSIANAGGGESPVLPDGSAGGSVVTLPAGRRSSLRAAWASCTTTAACGGAETYLVIDPTSKQLATKRESMVVSWYASSGAFDVDRVGRDGTDLATSVVNGWTAPSFAGRVHLWVVLRDDRGGVGWASYTVAVSP